VRRFAGEYFEVVYEYNYEKECKEKYKYGTRQDKDKEV
jgi:hypothetical protein